MIYVQQSLCTHLIYGYAGINAKNHKVIPLHPSLYRSVIHLKKDFPALKIYLSIGGTEDPYEESHKYLTVVSLTQVRQLKTILLINQKH